MFTNQELNNPQFNVRHEIHIHEMRRIAKNIICLNARGGHHVDWSDVDDDDKIDFQRTYWETQHDDFIDLICNNTELFISMLKIDRVPLIKTTFKESLNKPLTNEEIKDLDDYDKVSDCFDDLQRLILKEANKMSDYFQEFITEAGQDYYEAAAEEADILHSETRRFQMNNAA